MKTPITKPAAKSINWTPLSDPLTEAELNIELNWTADERTRQAIERQAAIMGFESPTAYLHQALAAVIAGNEEDTVVTRDGRLAHGCSLERDPSKTRGSMIAGPASKRVLGHPGAFVSLIPTADHLERSRQAIMMLVGIKVAQGAPASVVAALGAIDFWVNV